ncbi:MAG: hypothetical protein K0Q95_1748 [Bacteroidota bacterium]|jgi:hypothetical protein|nr:hypothetical protein [Bacteroidota bacterium]
MKKIYTLAIAGLFAGASNAQTAFFTPTTYRGAFPVTDLTPATDWTNGWTNWNPENTPYGNPTVTVSSNITTNTTWTTGTIVSLQNKVYVKNGAVLTIQPGVIIRGDLATQGTLIITRGSKIIAQGTSSNPIIFTSGEAVGDRAEGDWGGVVILGSGRLNQPGGIANIEGIAVSSDTEYGGSNDADSSGVFSFVRIEFPGIPLAPNKEINGLTMGGVGSKTVINHVQVSFSGDDSFEWFGGKVDAKYLIAFRGLDDDFDTDFGYRGRVQFGLAVRDADMSDAAGDSNSFESDNDATGTGALPRTSPIFSNITTIGPKRNGTVTLPTGEKFERAFYIRRNSALSIFNSIAASWEKGIYVKDAGTTDNFSTNDSAVCGNNLIASDISKAITVDANSSQSFYSSIFTNDNNDSTKTVSGIAWVNAFPSSLSAAADYRLLPTSVAATGASFSDAKFQGMVTGIAESIPAVNKVGVYPNPATNYVTLTFELAESSKVIANLYDITGKLVSNIHSSTMNSGVNTIEFNVNELPAGIYFANLNTGSLNKTMKLVVSK